MAEWQFESKHSYSLCAHTNSPVKNKYLTLHVNEITLTIESNNLKITKKNFKPFMYYFSKANPLYSITLLKMQRLNYLRKKKKKVGITLSINKHTVVIAALLKVASCIIILLVLYTLCSCCCENREHCANSRLRIIHEKVAHIKKYVHEYV